MWYYPAPVFLSLIWKLAQNFPKRYCVYARNKDGLRCRRGRLIPQIDGIRSGPVCAMAPLGFPSEVPQQGCIRNTQGSLSSEVSLSRLSFSNDNSVSAVRVARRANTGRRFCGACQPQRAARILSGCWKETAVCSIFRQ